MLLDAMACAGKSGLIEVPFCKIRLPFPGSSLRYPHPAEFAPAACESRAGNMEAVEHGSVADGFAVEGGGACRGFAPHDRDAALTGDLAQPVENPNSDGANARLLLRDNPRMDGERVEKDVSAPSPPAVCEPPKKMGEPVLHSARASRRKASSSRDLRAVASRISAGLVTTWPVRWW